MGVTGLRAISLFAGLTDRQVSELADAGEEVCFDEGCVLFREGEPADFWWVLLDGRLDLVRRFGHEESVVAVMERPGVWAGGFRAWTGVAGYLATGRAITAGRMLRIPAPALRELMRAWSPLGVHLIAGFFETVRNLEARYRQHEALVALGTLAAGLAHEIKNPASAATRSVDAMAEACDTLLSSLVQLAEASLRPDQFVAIDALRREIDPSRATSGSLAVADREDALSEWLSSHAVEDAWRIAPVLAMAGVSVTWCDSAAEALPGSTLEPGLEWVASTLSIASLLSEVKESARRISALVGAIKSYSQLDRASQQLIDVTEGLESTLVMLGCKLRDGVTVVRDYGGDLPRIEANPGELNQVWTNLIDNAIDAMGGQGTLRVSVRAEPQFVIIEVADTGPGMPPGVQARAFDPFYTTKDVGKGTGLGLDISRRIIERHHGEITIHSKPGETVLRVRLPAGTSPSRAARVVVR